MKKELERAVILCAKKASQQNDGLKSMQFAQAALNAAQAMSVVIYNEGSTEDDLACHVQEE